MLTPESVKDNFTYNPETGELRWFGIRIKYVKPWLENKLAGYIMKKGGRRVTFFKGKLRYNTHLIWLIVYGREPAVGNVIDHKDENPSNDRLANLQEILKGENFSKSYWNRRAHVGEGKPKQRYTPAN